MFDFDDFFQHNHPDTEQPADNFDGGDVTHGDAVNVDNNLAGNSGDGGNITFDSDGYYDEFNELNEVNDNQTFDDPVHASTSDNNVEDSVGSSQLTDEHIQHRHAKDDISFKGFGACNRCSCQAFEGTGQCCDNCGHNYSDHF